MTTLLVFVTCSDDSDFDWLRDRVFGAVKDVVETQKEEGRIDGEVDVSWDIAD